jgi:hypothetical protein
MLMPSSRIGRRDVAKAQTATARGTAVARKAKRTKGLQARPRQGKAMEAGVLPLDILVTKEADWWVAHCLQYDLAAQAKTLADLRYAFEHALVAHVVVSLEKRLEPFDSLPPAPKKYWEAWERALPIETESVAPPAFRLPRNIPKGVIPSARQFRIGDLVA